jgi:hypothetical protein
MTAEPGKFFDPNAHHKRYDSNTKYKWSYSVYYLSRSSLAMAHNYLLLAALIYRGVYGFIRSLGPDGRN